MRCVRIGFVLSLLWGPAALAHTRLDAPPDWLVTDSAGDPQKTEPCGSTTGTPSNVVTTVQAGSKLTVVWTETLFHPGHWRIAIASDRGQLVTPVPVVEANDCVSAPIETSPIAPVILDGIFPHISPSATGSYRQEITVPDVVCDHCTLQLVQFMSSHAPPCFYFHCADLRIVRGDAGVGTGGGGASPPGAGASGCGMGPGGVSALGALAFAVLSRRSAARR